MGITGFKQIDMLIGVIPRDWIVEFYGDDKLVYLLLHYTLAYQSSFGKVLLFHTVDFGGLDPYLLQKLSKILHGDIDRVYISRGFRLGDVVEGLKNIMNRDYYRCLILAYPYYHLLNDPSIYRVATMITGYIKKIAQSGKRVILFNSLSRFGKYYPDGGSYHHHTVHVIIRLIRRRNGRGVAEIFKHPWKPIGARTLFYIDNLVGWNNWGGQRLLSEWLYIKN